MLGGKSRSKALSVPTRIETNASHPKDCPSPVKTVKKLRSTQNQTIKPRELGYEAKTESEETIEFIEKELLVLKSIEASRQRASYHMRRVDVGRPEPVLPMVFIEPYST